MTSDAPALQAALVENLQASGVLTEPRVAAAFRAVPRHRFLPGTPLEEAYRDEAIPTKMAGGRAISASSQPAIMAIMLEQLAVEPGQRVLEIGAGTGYNAALLGWLAGPSGRVVTIDIDEDIVAAAHAHLAEAGIDNVRVIQADGAEGFADDGPYDRIILTVGAWDIAPAWHEQLAAGGRLVLPLALGNGAQNAIAFDKPQSGGQPLLVSRSVRACGFMPLRGAFAGPEVVTALGGAGSSLSLISPRLPDVPAERIYAWLLAGAERTGTGLRLTEAEIYGSLLLWLDVRSDAMAVLTIEEAPPPPGGWPRLFKAGRRAPTSLTVLLQSGDGLAVLDGRDQGGPLPGPAAAELGPFELRMIAYGPDGPQCAQGLLGLLNAWDKAGRPPSAEVQVRVFGRDDPYAPAARDTLVIKRATRLAITWPGPAALPA